MSPVPCRAAAPRDFCLIRYWRDNFDGSYVICLDSTAHPECPLVEGYVRGDLHAAYIVAPPKGKLGGQANAAKVRITRNNGGAAVKRLLSC